MQTLKVYPLICGIIAFASLSACSYDKDSTGKNEGNNPVVKAFVQKVHIASDMQADGLPQDCVAIVETANSDHRRLGIVDANCFGGATSAELLDKRVSIPEKILSLIDDKATLETLEAYDDKAHFVRLVAPWDVEFAACSDVTNLASAINCLRSWGIFEVEQAEGKHNAIGVSEHAQAMVALRAIVAEEQVDRERKIKLIDDAKYVGVVFVNDTAGKLLYYTLKDALKQSPELVTLVELDKLTAMFPENSKKSRVWSLEIDDIPGFDYSRIEKVTK